ncbi:hypothetical protein CLF_112534 [Clonorchis sinensis]|uniref:Uncharacterized protein n=1 Tax=Clonorchis sinensis TaxID=79923 RepID=G7YWJ7_CLOSI|nr:hypothetical protein CLF_112534 [Clonorchis sinensis]
MDRSNHIRGLNVCGLQRKSATKARGKSPFEDLFKAGPEEDLITRATILIISNTRELSSSDRTHTSSAPLTMTEVCVAIDPSQLMEDQLSLKKKHDFSKDTAVHRKGVKTKRSLVNCDARQTIESHMLVSLEVHSDTTTHESSPAVSIDMRLQYGPESDLDCIGNQLNVLHQAVSVATIFEMSRYMYMRNALLTQCTTHKSRTRDSAGSQVCHCECLDQCNNHLYTKISLSFVSQFDQKNGYIGVSFRTDWVGCTRSRCQTHMTELTQASNVRQDSTRILLYRTQLGAATSEKPIPHKIGHKFGMLAGPASGRNLIGRKSEPNSQS